MNEARRIHAVARSGYTVVACGDGLCEALDSAASTVLHDSTWNVGTGHLCTVLGQDEGSH